MTLAELFFYLDYIEEEKNLAEDFKAYLNLKGEQVVCNITENDVEFTIISPYQEHSPVEGIIVTIHVSYEDCAEGDFDKAENEFEEKYKKAVYEKLKQEFDS